MSREAFEGALRLWLGEAVSVSSVDELVEIGRAADRFGMLRVCEAVQDAICAQLNKDWRVCVDTLNCCDGSALEKAAAHARKIAVDCFDALCASERLCELSAKELCALLDNDELCVDKEEEVLELVARWCNVRGDGGDDGVRLVGMVRFGVMGRDYLEGRAAACSAARCAKELCALLDNDELCVDKEEEVLELVARWCNVRGDGGDDGVRLVGMVRFGVMGRDYLEGRACGLFRGAVRQGAVRPARQRRAVRGQ
eukprot:CAMPEP_0113701806 /NCGR_PEP_ID=MMETSP0038_2-20120614/24798_1 /TAXON_ID=2898 /ORGANISM="Cryptomonas paramecium" /LENGTH=253 /DNA_ID=CAMNT_0000625777 /DNA_START=293 /DNA_END=1052 /DNA_ORIENTATION=+ /assembly_acc=CAM_ASM_000170